MVGEKYKILASQIEREIVNIIILTTCWGINI